MTNFRHHHFLLNFPNGAEFVHDSTYNQQGDLLAVCCTFTVLVLSCSSTNLTQIQQREVSEVSQRHTHNQSISAAKKETPSAPPFYDDSGRRWTMTVVDDKDEKGTPHRGPVWSADWSLGQPTQWLATGCEDGCVRIFSPVEIDGDVKWVFRHIFEARFAEGRRNDRHDITKVRFGPMKFKRTLLGAACADGSVRIYTHPWDEENCVEVVSHKTEKEVPGCTSIAWSPDLVPMTFAVAGTNGELKLWMETDSGLKEWTCVAKGKSHTDQIKDVGWSPNLCRTYDLIATCGCGLPSLCVWRLDTPSKVNRGDPRKGGGDSVHQQAPGMAYRSNTQKPPDLQSPDCFARFGDSVLQLTPNEFELTCLQTFSLLPTPVR
eukprot:GHVN01080573.1.p1 GENE.GHVN01080573.1~~GHVN01080573.1.p1  ORF type:complete len:376 (+),score=55.88 GHVN01080573.1:393-1520(+)